MLPNGRRRLLCTMIGFFFMLLLAAIPSIGTIDRLSDLRSLSMGSAGIALTEANGTFLRNPAVLHRRVDPLFRIGARYSETIDGNSPPADPIPWIQMPTTALEMLFSNRFVALSIGLGNVLQDRTIDGSELHFTAFNESRLQLTAAYGWQTISLGLFAQGGNRTDRKVVIREGNALTDYLTRTYLERYDENTADGQFFSSGVGLLLSYQWVSIGLMTDSLFNMDYETNELVLDIADVFDGAALGIAVSSPVFNEDDELNRIVLNAVFDAVDLGSTDLRTVRFGLEGKVQFLSNLWVAARTGYWEFRPADEALFAIDGSGMLTFGLGGRIGNSGIDLVLEVPLDSASVTLTAGLTWGM